MKFKAHYKCDFCDISFMTNDCEDEFSDMYHRRIVVFEHGRPRLYDICPKCRRAMKHWIRENRNAD